MPVSYDFCQKVKCGIIPQSQVSQDDLYACSVQFGAGVLYPCHADCKQYGACPAPPIELPLPIQALPTTVALDRAFPNPVAPQNVITVEKLIQPVPDIVALQVPLVVNPNTCVGDWAYLNSMINMSPMCAIVALGAGLLILATVKKGR